MKKLSILLVTMLSFAGCGNNQSKEAIKTSLNEVSQMVEVRIETSPKKLLPNQIATIQAYVTQGEENVNDADEVEFEVWMEGQDDHEKVLGEPQGNGLYSIEKEFKDEGLYYIIAHVTARGMHTMPKQKIVVGSLKEDEGKEGLEQRHSQNYVE